MKSVIENFCKKGWERVESIEEIRAYFCHSVMEMLMGLRGYFIMNFLNDVTVTKHGVTLFFFLAKKIRKGHGVAKRTEFTSRIIISYSFKFIVDFLLFPISGRGYKLKPRQALGSASS